MTPAATLLRLPSLALATLLIASCGTGTSKAPPPPIDARACLKLTPMPYEGYQTDLADARLELPDESPLHFVITDWVGMRAATRECLAG